jgi:uncharacterized NAD(P)/FAD-binding protein YdhS/predicted metal-dependent enzyme (double-stranded beta helix superfamily)
MTENVCSSHNLQGFTWLIGELDKCIDVLDLPTVRRLLGEAQLDNAQVAPYIERRTDTYARRCVVRRENYEVLVLTWPPSQQSFAHDHAGSLCGLKVVHGELIEELYRECPDGRVRRISAAMFGSGQITIDPGIVVHSLTNSSADEELITVHIYSPPLAVSRSYAVAEGPLPKVFSRPARTDAKVVAIVGGGFTGVMAFANLFRFSSDANQPLHFILIERQPAVGDGVAYRTRDANHLLNVPVGRMSAWPDMPEDFLTFARSECSLVGPGDFLPRSSYGKYVRDTMFERAIAAGEHISAEILRDEVQVVTPQDPSRWRIETKGGNVIHADIAILAVGHRPPSDPLSARWSGPKNRLIKDPWASLVLSQIGRDESVTLIGSGLTAVDAILTLSRLNRTAPIIAVSRHGFLPKAHFHDEGEMERPAQLMDCWLDLARTPTVRGMMSTFRQQVKTFREAGIQWQQVLDSLRSATPRLWDLLTVKERSRFLRHVRPLWEIHRHRMPPFAAEIVHRLQREEKLEIAAGSLVSASADAQGIDVTFSCRGTSTVRSVRTCWVVNCTGPGAHNRHFTHPFLRPLLDAGTLCDDELNLGLLTDDCGRAISSNGHVHSNLLIAGTLRKATLWESTAVPELRQQAQTAARMALSALSRVEVLQSS